MEIRRLKTKIQTRLSSGLCGMAGEYAVASAICRQGHFASITIRNAKGIDILATNQTASRSAAIQVKTNQDYKKRWLLNSKAETFHEKNFFYIFVNLGTLSRYPEFHIVPSRVVAKFVKHSHQNWLKTPGRKGQVRNDTKMRQFWDTKDKYLNRWDLLGLDT